MSANNDLLETLSQLYRELYRAMLGADIKALSSILTDDFHLIHMTGYDQSRSEWLAHIESGRMRYFASTEEEICVDVIGEKMILVGRNRVDAEIWGIRGVWPLCLEINCMFENGRWLISMTTASTY